MKPEKRANKGVVSLKTWMKLATHILVKVEKREAGAIERWLCREDTYRGGYNNLTQ